MQLHANQTLPRDFNQVGPGADKRRPGALKVHSGPMVETQSQGIKEILFTSSYDTEIDLYCLGYQVCQHTKSQGKSQRL